ncbi:MAG: hypothetical protein HY554_11900 [Elusimicrobia bacterium]|nr:hypothetical protein [Elusimicrobiota bacterium]
MKGRAAWTLLALSLAARAPAAGEPGFRLRLAGRHAPVVRLGLGPEPKADYLARFDFDGDWAGANNWANLERFPLPAYVYYDVRETRTHYFLTYAFFHPRDYKLVGGHENDLEGVVLTVQKDGGRFGGFRLLETLAHASIQPYSSEPGVTNGRKALKGPAPLDAEGRVTLFIEPRGHGVHEGHAPLDVDEALAGELTYVYRGVAEDPAGRRDGSFGYALLPIDELWRRRGQAGRDQTFSRPFAYEGSRFAFREPIPGAFTGRVGGDDKASPPWGWRDVFDRGVRRGDWFLDPAHAASTHVAFAEPFSLEYLHNPYLEGAQPREAPPPLALAPLQSWLDGQDRGP